MKLEDFIGKELPERDEDKVKEADAFYEIAQFAEEKFKNEKKIKRVNIENMYVVTAIMNMAFSCELYLKSFFPGKKEGHYLNELFNEMPKNIKEFIKFEFISNGIVISEEHFDERLENISNSFAEWRYFYEEEKKNLEIDFEFLRVFAYALRILESLYR